MYEYRAKCVNVVDGDTFDFDVDLGFHITFRIRVRLKGIDTPEKNSKNKAEREHAKAAEVFAEEQLLGDPHDPNHEPVVTLRTEKDRIGIYGRYTASVTFTDGEDLADLLRGAGFEKKASYPEAGQLGQ